MYAVGQAIRDPKSGMVLLVNGIRFDATLPGLEAGQAWALIDLTFGNTGDATITVRPLGDLGVRAEGVTTFYTEPPFADRELGDKAGTTPMANTDIAPGRAVRRLLAVKVPATARNLVLWHAPGLILGTASADSAKFEVALGR